MSGRANKAENGEAGRREKLGFAGCALTLLTVNGLVLGLIAWSFSQGPYWSHQQEFLYRYVSIALLMLGAVLPAAALVWRAGRTQKGLQAITVWMAAVLGAAIMYVTLSGGGV